MKYPKVPIININTGSIIKNFEAQRKKQVPKVPEEGYCPFCGKEIRKKYGYVNFSQELEEYGTYDGSNHERFDMEPASSCIYFCPVCKRELNAYVVDTILGLN